MNAFIDNRGFFYVFDNGKINQIEFQPIQEFKVGWNAVAYIDFQNRFKIYFNGVVNTIDEDIPSDYRTTDFLLYFRYFNDVFILDGKKVRLMERWVKHEVIGVGDSIIAFNDNFDFFKVYYNGQITTIDQWPAKRIDANDNVVVYVNNQDQFMAFHKGLTYSLETSNLPFSYQLDRDIVAYVDYMNNFVVFDDGDIQELYNFRPKSYKVGQQLVAYVNHLDEFRVYYKGDNIKLMDVAPNRYEVGENILMWVDRQNHTHVFYKGEIFEMEYYAPAQFQLDNDLFVYTDLDSKLKGLYKGKKMEISDEVVNYFKVHNHTCLFWKVPNQPKFWNDGKVYTAF